MDLPDILKSNDLAKLNDYLKDKWQSLREEDFEQVLVNLKGRTREDREIVFRGIVCENLKRFLDVLEKYPDISQELVQKCPKILRINIETTPNGSEQIEITEKNFENIRKHIELFHQLENFKFKGKKEIDASCFLNFLAGGIPSLEKYKDCRADFDRMNDWEAIRQKSEIERYSSYLEIYNILLRVFRNLISINKGLKQDEQEKIREKLIEYIEKYLTELRDYVQKVRVINAKVVEIGYKMLAYLYKLSSPEIPEKVDLQEINRVYRKFNEILNINIELYQKILGDSGFRPAIKPEARTVVSNITQEKVKSMIKMLQDEIKKIERLGKELKVNTDRLNKNKKEIYKIAGIK
jgi:hypothetical protein